MRRSAGPIARGSRRYRLVVRRSRLQERAAAETAKVSLSSVHSCPCCPVQTHPAKRPGAAVLRRLGVSLSSLVQLLGRDRLVQAALEAQVDALQSQLSRSVAAAPALAAKVWGRLCVLARLGLCGASDSPHTCRCVVATCNVIMHARGCQRALRRRNRGCTPMPRQWHLESTA